MIPCFPTRWQSQDWKSQLSGAVTDRIQLLHLLNLEEPMGTHISGTDFPLRVPLSFIARMRPGDWDDPLLLQVLPQNRENLPVPGFDTDPLQEQSSQTPWLHKYTSRVLVMLAGACAVNCRYCFRRHFPYSDYLLTPQRRQALYQYLNAHTDVSEVILSGGEPLLASDQYLADLLDQLSHIPHLRRIRIHTRLPVVLPARITDQFTAVLAAGRLNPVLVIHANHPAEINSEVAAALKRLVENGVSVFNQSVLLQNINAAATTLKHLYEALFECRVIPYYLHLLDPVSGAAHFAVSESKARQIMAQLWRELPGFLLPTLVREIPGQRHKTPIDLQLNALIQPFPPEKEAVNSKFS